MQLLFHTGIKLVTGAPDTLFFLLTQKISSQVNVLATVVDVLCEGTEKYWRNVRMWLVSKLIWFWLATTSIWYTLNLIDRFIIYCSNINIFHLTSWNVFNLNVNQSKLSHVSHLREHFKMIITSGEYLILVFILGNFIFAIIAMIFSQYFCHNGDTTVNYIRPKPLLFC